MYIYIGIRMSSNAFVYIYVCNYDSVCSYVPVCRPILSTSVFLGVYLCMCVCVCMYVFVYVRAGERIRALPS